MPSFSAFETHHDEVVGPVIARRRLPADNSLDITPMIDVTFLLLIFFLVTNTPDQKTAVKLPAAENGAVVSRRNSFIISLASDTPQSALIFLRDGKIGEPVRGVPSAQEAVIRDAVEARHRDGVDQVILKAERRVPFSEVSRVLRAASVEGVRIDVAVMELR